MEEKPKKTLSRQRTTTEQLETYIDFLENKPDFLASKNTPKNPKFVEETWTELAAKLNAQRGPTKIPKEWKQSLGHWKNQLKFRARKNKTQMLLTGGGVTKSYEFTNFEDRALRCFGSVSISGDECIPTLGFENDTPKIVGDNDNHFKNERKCEDLSTSDSVDHELVVVDAPVSSTKSRIRGNSTIAEAYKKILMLTEERIASEKQMAQNRFEMDQMNAQSMSKIADAMNIMATLLTKK